MAKFWSFVGLVLLSLGMVTSATDGVRAAAENGGVEVPVGWDLPLWEVGVAGSAFYGPDYPASDEYHVNGIAAPFVIYRGKIFQLGERGIARAIALDNPYFSLDLSFDAAFRADSDRNDARQGMPDLDYLGEIGPRLTIKGPRYVNGRGGRGTLDLELPVRAVFATDFTEIDHVGYVFEPGLRLRYGFDARRTRALNGRVVSIWATNDLHDYFYEVPARFARADRPTFDAESGYMGSEATLTYSMNLTDRLRLFLTGRVGLYSGAANRDSPLFRDELNGAVSLSFTWSFFRSDETVRVE